MSRGYIIWRGAVAADTIITLFVDAKERKRYRRRESPGFCRVHELSESEMREHRDYWSSECGRQRVHSID